MPINLALANALTGGGDNYIYVSCPVVFARRGAHSRTMGIDMADSRNVAQLLKAIATE